MNRKYMIGGFIAIIFIVLAVVSFTNSSIEYSDFATARKNPKSYQIIGTYMKDKPIEYIAEKNLLTFELLDEKGESAKVQYTGIKPQNFDIATRLVVKGKFEGEIFKSTEILTQCPSKYETEKK